MQSARDREIADGSLPLEKGIIYQVQVLYGNLRANSRLIRGEDLGDRATCYLPTEIKHMTLYKSYNSMVSLIKTHAY
jgi:hypothetical protein